MPQAFYKLLGTAHARRLGSVHLNAVCNALICFKWSFVSIVIERYRQAQCGYVAQNDKKKNKSQNELRKSHPHYIRFDISHNTYDSNSGNYQSHLAIFTHCLARHPRPKQ
jgi:hypothetical protein